MSSWPIRSTDYLIIRIRSGKSNALLAIGRSQIPSVKVLQVFARHLEFLVAQVPGFPQFLPFFEFLRIGREGKAERLQGGIGEREPCFGFVQRPDNVLASYVGKSTHTRLDGSLSSPDSGILV
jgi:hypothetical protein